MFRNPHTEPCHPFLPENLARISYALLRSPTTEEPLPAFAPPLHRSVNLQVVLFRSNRAIL
jgi:hypothetical protein